jgi:hypothetical protein
MPKQKVTTRHAIAAVCKRWRAPPIVLQGELDTKLAGVVGILSSLLKDLGSFSLRTAKCWLSPGPLKVPSG